MSRYKSSSRLCLVGHDVLPGFCLVIPAWGFVLGFPAPDVGVQRVSVMGNPSRLGSEARMETRMLMAQAEKR